MEYLHILYNTLQPGDRIRILETVLDEDIGVIGALSHVKRLSLLI